MEINRRRMLQRLVLAAYRFKQMRMAMANADGYDSTQTIEVSLTAVIPDVLHLAFHNHQRLFVIEKDAGIEELLAQSEHFFGGRAGVGSGFVGGRRECWAGCAG